MTANKPVQDTKQACALHLVGPFVFVINVNRTHYRTGKSGIIKGNIRLEQSTWNLL